MSEKFIVANQSELLEYKFIRKSMILGYITLLLHHGSCISYMKCGETEYDNETINCQIN